MPLETRPTVPTKDLQGCPACGGVRAGLYFQQESFRTLRCLSCGLVYNNPQVLQRPIEEIYREDYFKSQNPALGYEDYVANKPDIQKTFARRLGEIRNHVSGGKLLDAGCACGFFLETAAGQGFQVEGIDCSSWATDYARQQYPYRIVTGYLDQSTEFEAGTFDLITFWDLIEQVPDPKPLFAKAAQLLKPGGVLALTVRDIESLPARLLGRRWIHFRPREKFVYFSRRSIRIFLESLGFEVLLSTRRNAGKDCTVDILLIKLTHAVPLLARFFSAAADFFKLRGRHVYINPGDTLLVLARKKAKA